MASTYSIEALILRRSPYREADRRILVLTPDRGKLELIARGAAKIRSKLAAHLEPFLLVQLLVANGKAYDTITASTVLHRPIGLAQSLVRKAWADYTAELLERVIQARQGDQIIFDLTRSTWDQFECLAVAKKKDFYRGFLILAAFVIKLMSRVGFQPVLQRCVFCQRRLQPEGNAYNFSLGGIICQRCQNNSKLHGSQLTLSGEAVRILRFILCQPYAAVRKLTLTDDQLMEVRKFSDKFVEYHTELIPRSQRFLTFLLRKKSTV